MRAAPLIPLFALGLAAAAALGQAPHSHQHQFGDADKWAAVFDDPKRDEWQKPNEVVKALGLKPNAIVADIGAGTGYFSMRLARLLPKGKIYAVDLEPEMVRHLASRAKRDELPNVFAVQAAMDDARLPEKVDLVLLVDTYHHIEDRTRYFGRLKGSLAPGGRVAIVDFTMDSELGPPPRARVSPEQVKRELGKAGYEVAAEHDFLPNQYFLIFKPN